MSSSPTKFSLPAALFLPLMSLAQTQYATDAAKPPIIGGMQSKAYSLLNINQLAHWVRSDGLSANAPDGDAGVTYPRQTAQAVFADGLVWAGMVHDGQQPVIRAGGGTYSVGTTPGRIIAPGVAELEDRIWRIRRDYHTANLRLDAAELHQIPPEQVTEAQMQSVREQYRRDWLEWPAVHGAPFYDANADGVYTPVLNSDGSPSLFPEADEPGLADADQVLWLVVNDLTDSTARKLYGSPPIGLEVQTTLWGYDSPPLENIIFKRYRLIYKGTALTPSNAAIDSMYLSQWSDPDLGRTGDDHAGCDTLIQLGYCYNALPVDEEYDKFNLPPPAIGYALLQGPIVPRAGSVAIFDLRKQSGYRNLPMTTFAMFGAGGGVSDPSRGGDYNGTLQWWNLMRGYLPRPENPPEPWRDLEGNVTRYRVPGDPVTGVGWIDETSGDRRLNFCTGPFQMALGDTNEAVIALVGGLGSDRLQSTSVIKHHARHAHQALENLFDEPLFPPAPVLFASELDGRLILHWSESPGEIERVEKWRSAEHRFEGYNIYQLPSPNAAIDQGIKLATFDLANEVTTILQEQFDPQAGVIISRAVQIGKNRGIQRTLVIDKDTLRNEALVNGRQYYFSVTTYSFNEQRWALTKTLESPLVVLTVTPNTLNPGYRLSAAIGDTLIVQHVQGQSDSRLFPIVADPARLTGGSYRITFSSTPSGELRWHLENRTTNTALLTNMTNVTGTGDYLIAEGIQPVVVAPSLGVKTQDQLGSPDSTAWGWLVPQGKRRFTWENANGLAFEGFRGAIGWSSPRRVFGDGVPGVPAGELKPVLLVLARVADVSGNFDPSARFDASDPNVSFAYRYGRAFGAPPAKPEFAPYIVNPGGGYAFQSFAKSVPLAAYDVSDPQQPRRLVLGHLENNVEGGLVDGKYFPGNHLEHSNTAGSGPREWLWIFDADYSEVSNPEFEVEAIGSDLPIMYWLTVANRSGTPWSPHGTGDDQFAIFPNRLPTEHDVFEFHTPAPSFDLERARSEALAQVNVYPNPYYGAFGAIVPIAPDMKFTHLPQQAIIRIFALSGTLVRTLEKDDDGQLSRWDLRNEHGSTVASGVYVAYIDMPQLGVSKILKLAVLQK